LWKELEQALPPDLRGDRTVRAAFDIAYEAHDGQFRAERDPGRSRIPYIVHPVGVAKMAVSNWREGELDVGLATVVAAALLHDVLEDSSVEYGDIAARTSEDIAGLVRQLTKPPVLGDVEKSERNRKFAQQIVAAGPMAVYIKICDALHNLSRPNGMPTTLLAKSVSKAERTYLPMLRGTPFESRMSDMLRATIDGCRKVAAQRATEEREFDPFDFASVVTHIERASGTKLLELHDLVEILAQIPGVSHAMYGGPVQSAAALATAYPDLGIEFWEALSGGAPGVRRLPGSPLARALVPFSHVLRAEESIYGRSDRGHGILLAYSEDAVPSWFRPETVAAIIRIATAKIDRHMQGVDLAVQGLARRCGVDLDVETIRAHAVSEQDVLAYVHARDVGRIFLAQIAYFIEEIVEKTRPHRPPELHSRVKALLSLLEKGRRHGKHFSNDVEDFLGLRLVCVSTSDAQALSQSISDAVTQGPALLSQGVEVLNPRTKRIDPVSGYKAIHIVFELQGIAFVDGRLGCEIQIRTVFEQAWAQVSESLRYKQQISGRHLMDRQLRELADRRDEAEVVVDALTAATLR
ncbi:MAG TPA: HD domain-containing protein, partial [Allosphingosinicella sp.]|nr:HD domain-containing protein [Allosphingosinicella sp.]